MATFDELFDDFMGDKPRDEDLAYNTYFKDLIASMFGGPSPDTGPSFEEKLGKPNEIREVNENGVKVKKLIWNTPSGRIIKTVIEDVESLIFKDENKSLEDKVAIAIKNDDKEEMEKLLDIAIKEDEFELAIELRDKLNIIK